MTKCSNLRLSFQVFFPEKLASHLHLGFKNRYDMFIIIIITVALHGLESLTLSPIEVSPCITLVLYATLSPFSLYLLVCSQLAPTRRSASACSTSCFGFALFTELIQLSWQSGGLQSHNYQIAGSNPTQKIIFSVFLMILMCKAKVSLNCFQNLKALATSLFCARAPGIIFSIKIKYWPKMSVQPSTLQ